ncbi:hypothetical protein GCM10010112_50930 [Actinoplanes lobatus]|nr:hypothetical protein GCM10010112_50930 [Actinoplanes lobatus]
MAASLGRTNNLADCLNRVNSPHETPEDHHGASPTHPQNAHPTPTAVHSPYPQNAAGVEASDLPTQRGVLRREIACLDTGYKAFCRGAKRSNQA